MTEPGIPAGGGLEDTIAAIATPLGEGGVAIVRLSGPRALAIADRCFQPAGAAARQASEAPTHTVLYGHATHAGRVIDEVLVTVMRAPRTFTREDVAEFSCHGGILVTRALLDALLDAGARLAEPGEYTKRAFLNGRIDLAQAEAVADLIQARTELALAAANEQLAGKLSRRIESIRDDLMSVLAHVEAHLDFPEEDIDPDTHGQLLVRLRAALNAIDQLLSTASEGQLLRRGIRVAIVGRPNVGKSSLLNQLLGHERAIVSAAPGTTRDTIEETANIRGLAMVFIDTAGLREATDDIEREGIRRSRASMERAELVLHVLDASRPLDPEEETLLRQAGRPRRILACNKTDLPRQLVLPDHVAGPRVDVCAVSGTGVEALKDALKEAVWSGHAGSDMLEVMINARHQDALRRAREALESARRALEADQPLDLVAVDLRIGVNAVGEVVGKTATEDLLDAVFRQFCIGK